ncbi:MAG: hypothetical protein HUJ87_15205 [Fusobacterium varium]|uniref:hypothetical protein n=1 Tax=Fusobacterium varium TaxID=856 RepID=UPI0024315C06|nr:hypothetical protein [Fusobacterium varium]MCF0171840.1 hypothetical protein [Fusobacterium varium]
MIEFLKNLSGRTSSMIGVIFAFLIGKILGYEEILNDIEENKNKKNRGNKNRYKKYWNFKI